MSESLSGADFLRGASFNAKTSISLQNLDPLPLLETYSFLVLALRFHVPHSYSRFLQ